MNVKVFMPDVDPKERIRILQENAEHVEETNYMRPLSPDELDQRRELVTDNAIKLSDLEDEKKEIVAEFKQKMDPLSKQNKLLLAEIKQKQANEFGTLYHLINHDEGMMETYNAKGEMLFSRRLRPNEMQKNIFSLRPAANHD